MVEAGGHGAHVTVHERRVSQSIMIGTEERGATLCSAVLCQTQRITLLIDVRGHATHDQLWKPPHFLWLFTWRRTAEPSEAQSSDWFTFDLSCPQLYVTALQSKLLLKVK